MNVIVDGATSMIGVALIDEYIKNGNHVLAIVRENSNRLNRLSKHESIEFFYSDISNLKNINIKNRNYDVYYHLAWTNTSKENRDNPVKQEENIQYSLDAVNLAHRCGCKKFIGAGSQAEYGYTKEVLDEELKPKPETAYGIAKYSSCLLTKRLCEQLGIQHIWARVCSVYGTNDNENTLIKYLLDCLEDNKEANLSSCNQYWNYLNEKDCGKYLYLLGQEDIDSGIYLVANDKSLILKEYIEQIRSLYPNSRINYSSSEGKTSLNVNMKKTINATGYVPEVEFLDGIKEIVSIIRMTRNI